MDYNSPLQFDDKGSYVTPPDKARSLLKGLPAAYFYPKLCLTVYLASRIAKRGLFDRETWAKTSYAVFDALERIGLVFEIKGINNLRSLKEPCVFIANHMSTLETAVLPVMIDPIKPVTFVIKDSLLRYPVFRHVMKAVRPIAVTRTNPKEDFKTVITEGSRMLAEGVSIVVFPQTTRTVLFDPSAFNTIGVKLAKNTNSPIIPLALKTDAWGNGKLVKDFGRLDATKKVYFEFGEPFYVKGRGTEEHKRVIDFIVSRLAGWGVQVATTTADTTD